jgi:hypothetical protein
MGLHEQATGQQQMGRRQAAACAWEPQEGRRGGRFRGEGMRDMLSPMSAPAHP